ncbi:class II histone deacetylase, partial [Oceanospirillum sp. HFRX-1_2]
ELIVVACGYDAAAMDPLGCMILNSHTFATMTRALMDTADRLCNGKLVMIHEGGYSEGYVHFCGHAVIETLSEASIKVPDPLADDIAGWGQQDLQPHQQALLDRLKPLLEDVR